MRRPTISPFWPVPRDEQLRQSVGAFLALSEGNADELRSVANVCAALLDDCDDEDAREAVQKAADALLAHRAGRCSTADLKIACVPLVHLWVALLRQITLRRLLAAQDVARRAAEATAQ